MLSSQDMQEAAARGRAVKAVYVYEAPVRLWHWVNALAITVLALSGGRPVLAGRVFEVHPGFSKVMLVTSELSSVVCRLKGSGHEGMLEGRGARLLRLGYLQEKAAPQAGEEIVTSAGGLLFPAGIPVATVAGPGDRDTMMNLLNASAEPAVEPDSLQEVYVVNRDFPAEIRQYSEEAP
jgi:cell shape-determining protein MreC